MSGKSLIRNDGTLGHMGWYWCAVGLALKLRSMVMAYKQLATTDISKEVLDSIMDMLMDIREMLSFACAEHDRLLILADPCTDVGPLRYATDIATAIEEFDSVLD